MASRSASTGSNKCCASEASFSTPVSPAVPTSTNRQPALAAYARGNDGKHRPYGPMVLQVEADMISGIIGSPDPWLFQQCGLQAELN
jgi:hypothetical protein